MADATGYLEVTGYSVALYAMDKACKMANITILGIDSINPKDSTIHIPLTVQVKFSGNISDVQVALETARFEALKYVDEANVITNMISMPYEGTEKLNRISRVTLK